MIRLLRVETDGIILDSGHICCDGVIRRKLKALGVGVVRVVVQTTTILDSAFAVMEKSAR